MISYQFSSSSHQNGWSRKAEIPNVQGTQNSRLNVLYDIQCLVL